jgi:hypothetical protein
MPAAPSEQTQDDLSAAVYVTGVPLGPCASHRTLGRTTPVTKGASKNLGKSFKFFRNINI